MLIGMSGVIGSGKSAVGEILAHELGFRRVYFATALKDVCAALVGTPPEDRELWNGVTPESRAWRDQPLPNLELRGGPVTPRQLLQWVGTDACRNGLDKNIWVQLCRRTILDLRTQGVENIIVEDMRFPNEQKLITDLGGRLLMIRRPETEPEWLAIALRSRGGNRETYLEHLKGIGIHPSELEWLRDETAPYDYIWNDKTLADLRDKMVDYVYQLSPVVE